VKLVILCGGKGTRLGLGVQAVSQGFIDILLLGGHGADHIRQHFGDGARWGASIECVVEQQPLGTAGCFRPIRDTLDEPFIVLYGDIFHDVDLVAFAAFGRAMGGAGTLFVHPNDHPEDSDLVEVDEEQRIVAFHSKPHAPGSRLPNLVSAALYYLDPQALRAIPPEGPCDWGHDVFPALARTQPLFAYRSCEYAKDIGTPARLERVERHLREGRVARSSLRHAKPAVFIDRDGVINEECGGVLDSRQVQLIPGAGDAIHALNAAGIPAICVTNQPFVAKGQLDWAMLRAIGGEIDCQLASVNGAYLDDVRICPHHPETGWAGEVAALKIACDCRKPGPGMLIEAARFHNIDLERSWMIGDRYCDIAAGHRAGTKTALVRTGFGGSDRASYDVLPDREFDDLRTAVATILVDLL
jgi:mannose-1-phosphate guanylyltransferase/phosphomannomutase